MAILGTLAFFFIVLPFVSWLLNRGSNVSGICTYGRWYLGSTTVHKLGPTGSGRERNFTQHHWA